MSSLLTILNTTYILRISILFINLELKCSSELHTLHSSVMEQFLFQTERFQRIYNCSFYSVDSVPVDKRQNIPFGILLLIVGLFEEVLKGCYHRPLQLMKILLRTL